MEELNSIILSRSEKRIGCSKRDWRQSKPSFLCCKK